MPKIFEYLGILIYFHSNEHEPIHVHGKHGEFESKAEIYLVEGQIEEIKIKTVKGHHPLTGNTLRNFEDFLRVYAGQIVQKWVDYFVYNKNVPFERINTHLP